MKNIALAILFAAASAPALGNIPSRNIYKNMTVSSQLASFEARTGHYEAKLNGCTREELSTLEGTVEVSTSSIRIRKGATITLTDETGKKLTCVINGVSKL